MLQGYIVDPESGKVVAVIRHGEVFREDKDGVKIASVVNANLYDLSGNLIGRLDGPHAIDVRTWSMLGPFWKEKPRTTRFLRIPRQSGQGFRFDVGHRSDLIPATIPK
jgi:hypothetical protein